MLNITKELYCDVAVVGGGTGGCAAAIAASRKGARTILLDRGVSLGGLATNGCVLQVAGCIEGLCLEFVQTLDSMGHLRQTHNKDYYRNPSFDPEFGKLVLENMVVGSGCRIIYDSTCIDVEMDGTNIKSAIFYTKGGLMKVHAKIFVDGTGDADLSCQAGVPYENGGGDFAGLNASTTLGSRWAGANIPKYLQAEKEFREEQQAKGVEQPLPLLYTLEEEAIKRGELIRHVSNRGGLYRVMMPNTADENSEFAFFGFHSYYCHNTDVEDLSRQVVEQHQMMQHYHRFLKENVPGFEHVRLVCTGSIPGVRDSRRTFGEYMLKTYDIVCGTKFEDGIARFPEMLDTHHPTSNEHVFICHTHLRSAGGSALTRPAQCSASMHPFGKLDGCEARPSLRDYCDIPYRCLLPLNVDNLLTVGRCCSAEFHAMGGMRIIGSAMGTGHAAGIAAAKSVKDGVRPRDIDGKLIRQILIEEENVPLDQPPDGYWKELREKEGEMRVDGRDSISLFPVGG